jgi:hypothetical protein
MFLSLIESLKNNFEPFPQYILYTAWLKLKKLGFFRIRIRIRLAASENDANLAMNDI